VWIAPEQFRRFAFCQMRRGAVPWWLRFCKMQAAEHRWKKGASKINCFDDAAESKYDAEQDIEEGVSDATSLGRL